MAEHGIYATDFAGASGDRPPYISVMTKIDTVLFDLDPWKDAGMAVLQLAAYTLGVGGLATRTLRRLV